MSAFVKSIPFAERVIRRNPLYYRGFRSLLERAENAGLAERRAMVEELLGRSDAWARQLPGYAQVDLARPLAEQPILIKETLQTRAEDFQRRGWLPVSHAATGGSTGVPLQLIRSPQSLTMEQAMIDHLAAKAGVDLQHARVAVLRIDRIKDPNDEQPPFWRQIGPRRLVLSSMHLNARRYPLFEQKLREFRPDVLLSLPSSLEMLTDLAGEHRSSIGLKLVITSSEMLRAGLRARVRNCFGAALIDYYGMAERVCTAYSLEDGRYHFVLPYGLAELLSLGGGRYRILGTSFWNRCQPLRRYDTEDIAILPGEASPQELERVALGLDPFSGIEGRSTDYFLLADGSRLYTMDQIPLGVTGAATVQLIQESPEAALVVVVPNGKFSDHTLETIRRNFYARAPRTVEVRVEVRDTPYRLANGKAPAFISNLARA